MWSRCISTGNVAAAAWATSCRSMVKIGILGLPERGRTVVVGDRGSAAGSSEVHRPSAGAPSSVNCREQTWRESGAPHTDNEQRLRIVIQTLIDLARARPSCFAAASRGMPMKKIAVACCFVLSLLSGRFVSAQLAPIADPEAYAVYAAVIPRAFNGTPLDHIALLDETRFNDCRGIVQAGEQWRPLLNDFRAQNATVRTFVPQMFDLGVPVEFVPLSTVLGILKAHGWAPGVRRGSWDSAYASFPAGRLITLSAVGFSPDRSFAMVTVAFNCGTSGERQTGADCGQGDTRVLQKQQDRWVPVTEQPRPGCGFIA